MAAERFDFYVKFGSNAKLWADGLKKELAPAREAVSELQAMLDKLGTGAGGSELTRKVQGRGAAKEESNGTPSSDAVAKAISEQSTMLRTTLDKVASAIETSRRMHGDDPAHAQDPSLTNTPREMIDEAVLHRLVDVGERQIGAIHAVKTAIERLAEKGIAVRQEASGNGAHPAQTETAPAATTHAPAATTPPKTVTPPATAPKQPTTAPGMSNAPRGFNVRGPGGVVVEPSKWADHGLDFLLGSNFAGGKTKAADFSKYLPGLKLGTDMGLKPAKGVELEKSELTAINRSWNSYRDAIMALAKTQVAPDSTERVKQLPKDIVAAYRAMNRFIDTYEQIFEKIETVSFSLGHGPNAATFRMLPNPEAAAPAAAAPVAPVTPAPAPAPVPEPEGPAPAATTAAPEHAPAPTIPPPAEPPSAPPATEEHHGGEIRPILEKILTEVRAIKTALKNPRPHKPEEEHKEETPAPGTPKAATPQPEPAPAPAPKPTTTPTPASKADEDRAIEAEIGKAPTERPTEPLPTREPVREPAPAVTGTQHPLSGLLDERTLRAQEAARKAQVQAQLEQEQRLARQQFNQAQSRYMVARQAASPTQQHQEQHDPALLARQLYETEEQMDQAYERLLRATNALTRVRAREAQQAQRSGTAEDGAAEQRAEQRRLGQQLQDIAKIPTDPQAAERVRSAGMPRQGELDFGAAAHQSRYEGIKAQAPKVFEGIEKANPALLALIKSENAAGAAAEMVRKGWATQAQAAKYLGLTTGQVRDKVEQLAQAQRASAGMSKAQQDAALQAALARETTRTVSATNASRQALSGLSTATQEEVDKLQRLIAEGASNDTVVRQQARAYAMLNAELAKTTGMQQAGRDSVTRSIMQEAQPGLTAQEFGRIKDASKTQYPIDYANAQQATSKSATSGGGGATQAGSKSGNQFGQSMGDAARGTFERSFFGNQGFFQRVVHSMGTFVVRNFSAGAVFGLANALQDAIKQGLDTQSTFVRVSSALEATGRSSDGLRGKLQDLSQSYGTALQDVYTTAAGLTGLFDATDVGNQQLVNLTKVALQLELISGGALNATEAMRSLASVTAAYGKDSSQSVADVATVIQNQLGVNVEDTIEGVSRLSGEAKIMGLNFRDTATYVASIAKLTGQSGEAAGEQFSRILMQMQTGKAQAVLQKSLGRIGINIGGALVNQDYSTVFKVLLGNYDKLKRAEKERISIALGGSRQAAAINALLSDGAKVLDVATKAQHANGDAQERAAKISDQLQNMMKRGRAAFVNFVTDLADLGAFNALGIVLKAAVWGLDTLNKALATISDFFDSSPLLKGLKYAITIVGGLALGFKALTWAIRGTMGALGNTAVVKGFTAATAKSTAAVEGEATAVAGGTAATTATAGNAATVGLLARRNNPYKYYNPYLLGRKGPAGAAAAAPEAEAAARTFAVGSAGAAETNLLLAGSTAVPAGSMLSRFFQRRAAGLGRASVNFGAKAEAATGRMASLAEEATTREAAGLGTTGLTGAMRGAQISEVGAATAAKTTGALSTAFTGLAGAAGPLTVGLIAAAGAFFTLKAGADSFRKSTEEYNQIFKDAFGKPANAGNPQNRKDVGTVQSLNAFMKDNADQNSGFTGAFRGIDNFVFHGWRGFGANTARDVGRIPDDVTKNIEGLRTTVRDNLKQFNGKLAKSIDPKDLNAAIAENDKTIQQFADSINTSGMSTAQKANVMRKVAKLRVQVNDSSQAVSLALEGMTSVEALTSDQIQNVGGLVSSLTSMGNDVEKQFGGILTANLGENGFTDKSQLGRIMQVLAQGYYTKSTNLGPNKQSDKLTVNLPPDEGITTPKTEMAPPPPTPAQRNWATYGRNAPNGKSPGSGYGTQVSAAATPYVQAWLNSENNRRGGSNTYPVQAVPVNTRPGQTPYQVRAEDRVPVDQYRKYLPTPDPAKGPGVVEPHIALTYEKRQDLGRKALQLAIGAANAKMTADKNNAEALAQDTANAAQLTSQLAQAQAQHLQDQVEAASEAVTHAEHGGNFAAAANAGKKLLSVLKAQHDNGTMSDATYTAATDAARDTMAQDNVSAATKGYEQQKLSTRNQLQLAQIGYNQAVTTLDTLRKGHASYAAILAAQQAKYQAAITLADTQDNVTNATAMAREDAGTAPGDAVAVAVNAHTDALRTQAQALKKYKAKSQEYQDATRAVTDTGRGVVDALNAQASAADQIAVALAQARGDTIGAAAASVTAANNALTRAMKHSGGNMNTAEVKTAQGNVIAANAAYGDALTAHAQAVAAVGVAISTAQGDTVGASRKSLAAAQAALAAARRKSGGQETDAVKQAEAAVIQAQAALADNIQSRAAALMQLSIARAQAGGYLVLAAQRTVAAAQQALTAALRKSKGKNTEAVIQARTALVQAQAASRDAVLQDALDTIDFNRSMNKISVDTEIHQLQQLLKQKNLTKAQRRQIELQIHGLQMDIINSVTGSGLNISNGIKLPTPYQIRDSLGVDKARQAVADAMKPVTGSGSDASSTAAGHAKPLINAASSIASHLRAAANNANANKDVVNALTQVREAINAKGAQQVHFKQDNHISAPTAAVAQQIAKHVIDLINQQTGQHLRANSSTPRIR